MKKKTKEDNSYIGNKVLDKLWTMGLVLYLFAILVILPLYIYDHYWDMSWHKWKVYLSSTGSVLIFAGCILIVGMLYKLFARRKTERVKKIQPKSKVDKLVTCYGLLVVVSFITCSNRAAAWMGTEGWYMGVVAQLLFVATYFLFSKRKISIGILIVFHGTASVFCYFYAICQRLGNDWLHLYWDMPAEVVRDYLSTIGNRTWFSAYICTAFPIGMYLFWYVKKVWASWLTGAYMLLSFFCMVMVNSDSMYAGLFAALFVLGLLSVGDVDKLKRFLEVVMLWFAACVIMFVLRETIPEFPRDTRGLSQIFLNIKVSLPCFFMFFLSRFLLGIMDGTIKCKKLNFMQRQFKVLDKERRQSYQGKILKLTCFFAVATLVFIYCNTTDVFGVLIDNEYLVFDDNWGDNRGHTWKITFKMFSELPLMQKLFGAGADCFAYVAYSNAEYASILQNFWGESILANAHNEWLNSLFCFGIFGGFAYLCCFLGVVYECLWKTDIEKEHPLIPAIGLCVIAYMAHNFFCYQQVCATPIMFILMGVAVQLKKQIKG